MISLLIAILILGGIAAIIQVAPIPASFKQIGFIIVFIVLLVYLIQFLTGTPATLTLR